MRSTFDPRWLAPLLALGLAACATGGRNGHDSMPSAVPRPSANQGVVSVIINGQDPDFGSPWSKGRPWRRRINGLVVTGRRILVHGRRLSNSTLILVEKLGASKRYQAEVVEVDYEVPLGLLEVKDPEFWEGLEPIAIGDDVPSEGDVTICRWLDSGQFEEARAVVKQLRVDDHFPGEVDLLTLELSSSITAAGWGEVVVDRGEVVGLTTSASDDQLRAIAAPVLSQFLEHVESGTYRGFARHGFTWQRLGNAALRRKLGLKDEEGGIRIRDVRPHGSGAGVLQTDDVVLSIGGHRIDERGKFDHPEYGKLFFGVLFTDGTSPGDRLPVQVLREGARVQLELELRRMAPEQDVVPRYTYDQAPEYLVVGGLVFQPLSNDYLRRWKSWWTNGPLRILVEMSRKQGGPEVEDERLILLSRVLPDPVNLGYHDVQAQLVSKVNGDVVRTMDELRAALAHPKKGFHVVELLAGQSAKRVVIDAAAAKEADPGIRKRYRLPPPRAAR